MTEKALYPSEILSFRIFLTILELIPTLSSQVSQSFSQLDLPKFQSRGLDQVSLPNSTFPSITKFLPTSSARVYRELSPNKNFFRGVNAFSDFSVSLNTDWKTHVLLIFRIFPTILEPIPTLSSQVSRSGATQR